MIRFIIERKYKYPNGLEDDELETVDIDVPQLERILTDGGSSEDGYDLRYLLGVEVLRQEQTNDR